MALPATRRLPITRSSRVDLISSVNARLIYNPKFQRTAVR